MASCCELDESSVSSVWALATVCVCVCVRRGGGGGGGGEVKNNTKVVYNSGQLSDLSH